MGNYPVFQIFEILGEAGKQEILQQMFRKFQISNRLPNRYFPKIVVGCPWMNSKCFHATIFCLLIIFGHKNNSKAIKDQLKPTFKMPRRHLSVSDLNLTHGCLMKANIQTLQCSTETLLISDVMKQQCLPTKQIQPYSEGLIQ